MKRGYRGRILTHAGPVSAGSPGGGPVSAGSPGGGPALHYLEDGLLLVEDGRIASVTPFTAGPRAGADLIFDLRPCVLCPGFIDTHVHFPQTRVIGSASGPLLDWLERTVFPEEARFRDEAYARAVAEEFTAALCAAGTTTSAIFSSSSEGATDVLFEALDRRGLRAIAGLTLMDQACPEELRVSSAEAIAACARLLTRWHGHDRGRLGFAITPRFALSCSRPLLEGAARLAAEHDLLIQTHLAENPAEGDAVLAAHPYGEDYLGVYEATGLVTRRTLFAHSIHLSRGEWDRIAARGSAIAHCPDSNFFLGSGRMPLYEATSRGVTVGLGSDVAGGRSFCIRRAMAYAYDNALATGHPIEPEALFEMATLGGARALGIEGVTGSLEAGKDADFVALRLPDHGEGKARILGQIAFSDAGVIERVFVRGRLVHAAFGLTCRALD